MLFCSRISKAYFNHLPLQVSWHPACTAFASFSIRGTFSICSTSDLSKSSMRSIRSLTTFVGFWARKQNKSSSPSLYLSCATALSALISRMSFSSTNLPTSLIERRRPQFDLDFFGVLEEVVSLSALSADSSFTRLFLLFRSAQLSRYLVSAFFVRGEPIRVRLG